MFFIDIACPLQFLRLVENFFESSAGCFADWADFAVLLCVMLNRYIEQRLFDIASRVFADFRLCRLRWENAVKGAE